MCEGERNRKNDLTQLKCEQSGGDKNCGYCSEIYHYCGGFLLACFQQKNVREPIKQQNKNGNHKKWSEIIWNPHLRLPKYQLQAKTGTLMWLLIYAILSIVAWTPRGSNGWAGGGCHIGCHLVVPGGSGLCYGLGGRSTDGSSFRVSQDSMEKGY